MSKIYGNPVATPINLDKKLTIEQIGAAPAGYGLGGKTDEPKTDDLNDAAACGWYAFTDDTLNRPFNYGTVMVTNRYGNQITQLAFNPYMAGAGEMCVRHFYDNWTEWEYINPPMNPGVEYRTTKRHQGKVVYTKAINIGALPNNSTSGVKNLSTYGKRIVSSVLSLESPSDGRSANVNASNTTFTVAQSGDGWLWFSVKTTKDESAWNGILTIEYTKD